MSTKRIQWLYMVGDILLSMLAVFTAVLLRFEGRHIDDIAIYLIVAPVSVVVASFALGTYSSIWAYMGFSDVFRQFASSLLSACVFFFIKYTGLYPIWATVVVIYFGLVFVLTTGVRIIPRFRHWLRAQRTSGDRSVKRAVIIGAGTTGAMLIKRLLESADEGIYPVAALDSDPDKHGMRIAGVKVLGDVDRLDSAVRKYSATDVILAIPSIDSMDVASIYEVCKQVGVRLRIYQSAIDAKGYLSGGRHALRDVSIQDLLFRKCVEPDMREVVKFIQDKTVLVTGGAGSIGSELCRQVLMQGCKKLIVLDFHENGLFEINEELKQRFGSDRYQIVLASIRDRERLASVFAAYRPDIVFHAAAHKHVPMMEINPCEAVKNNVFGTKNVLECCIEYKVKRCILISTDKAVNTTNVMGATKRVAELLVQSMNGHGCEFAAVRFGNVLGSNGSVVHTFQRQIDQGGPVTVTHRDITRYFMTISEAVSLVLTAGALAKGGEIFVLDMGSPVKIYDLATDMIRLSGYEPGRDIKIEITGLRPGEKCFEELVQADESVDTTSHEKIFVMKSEPVDAALVLESVDGLRETLAKDGENAVRAALFGIVRQDMHRHAVR